MQAVAIEHGRQLQDQREVGLVRLALVDALAELLAKVSLGILGHRLPAVAEQRDQGADDAKGGERLLGRMVEGIEVQQYGALMGLTTAG